MRFLQTAIGYRVQGNTGRPVAYRLEKTTVVKVTAKGYLVLKVHEERDCRILEQVDIEVKRGAGISRGPWKPSDSTVVVKLGRGCRIVTGQQAVGSKEDMVPGRGVDSCRLALAGAFSGGYVWAADDIHLASLVYE